MEIANDTTLICKRRRICSDDTSTTVDELRETKLFHVNSDCLRNVFQYLDLKDIVNLAEANLSIYDDSETERNPRSTSRNYSYKEAIRDHFMRSEGAVYCVTNDLAFLVFSTRVFRHSRSLLRQISIPEISSS